MAGDYHAPSIASEQAPGHRVGPVELRHGAGPPMCRTAVSHVLAKGMQRKEQTVRQQLREWYYNAPRKRGTKRQALPVRPALHRLLGWVVSWWQGTQLALAIDATTWGNGLWSWRSAWCIAAVPSRGLGRVARARQAAWRRDGCDCCAACTGDPPRLDR